MTKEVLEARLVEITKHKNTALAELNAWIGQEREIVFWLQQLEKNAGPLKLTAPPKDETPK